MAVMWAMGITQHIVGVRNVMDLANLQMLLGNMGKPGGGVNPLRGQNNVQGACDMGGLPNVYPAYQPVINEEVIKKFQTAWGAAPGPKIGMTVTTMIPVIPEGGIKALYILGEDPASPTRIAPTSATASKPSTCSSCKKSSHPRHPNLPTSCCPASVSPKRPAPSPIPNAACRWCTRPSSRLAKPARTGKSPPTWPSASWPWAAATCSNTLR
jgi:hypothetical protein